MMTDKEAKAMQEIMIMGELAKQHVAARDRLQAAPLAPAERRRLELMLERAHAEQTLAARRYFGRPTSFYEKLIESLDRLLAEYGPDHGGTEH